MTEQLYVVERVHVASPAYAGHGSPISYDAAVYAADKGSRECPEFRHYVRRATVDEEKAVAK